MFQAVESDVDTLSEEGMKVVNDTTVQSFEAEEIRSDLKALDVRWSTVKTKTEKQRNRFDCFITCIVIDLLIAGASCSKPV